MCTNSRFQAQCMMHLIATKRSDGERYTTEAKKNDVFDKYGSVHIIQHTIEHGSTTERTERESDPTVNQVSASLDRGFTLRVFERKNIKK